MRIFVALLILALSITLMTGTAEAKESPFVKLMSKVFGFTTKTVEKEVNVVGEGVKKSTDIVVEEVKDVGCLVTGDGSKAKDVLVKPVTGTAEVAGETTYGVILRRDKYLTTLLQGLLQLIGVEVSGPESATP